jgi:hypothetical protein
VTRAAETTPTIDDDRVDQAFRLLEAAWVAAEFDEIIAASWPTDPPPPLPPGRARNAEPPGPGHPASDEPARRSPTGQVTLEPNGRQRSPPGTSAWVTALYGPTAEDLDG